MEQFNSSINRPSFKFEPNYGVLLLVAVGFRL